MDKTIDTSIIDRLYTIYLGEHLNFAKDCFWSALRSKPENGGGATLLENLKQYIEENSNKFPNGFSSEENHINEVEIISNLVHLFEDITYAVNNLLDDYELEHYSTITRENLFPVDMFKINPQLIKDAYKKYYNTENIIDDCVSNISPETLEKFLKLLDFIKTNNSLNKIYKSFHWKHQPLEDVLKNLYDYHGKNSLFHIGEKEMFELDTYVDNDVSYLKKIKDNCVKISSINFDQYRPNYISKKGINSDIDKLTFCRNLLNFYKTEIMPESYYNSLDFALNKLEENELKSNLKKCYSTAFDLETLKTHQCNVIYNVDQPLKGPEKLVTHQSICKNNSLAVGFLLSTDSRFRDYTNETYYLLHIYIEDITNPTCNYEIQLNILPDSKISHRIQLIRLDNWNSLQTHKNLSKKLTTTTHIHLYNPLDLLRGKKNGSFDISFNTNSASTDFETSFKTFLDILDLDDSLYNTVSKTINTKNSQSSKTI